MSRTTYDSTSKQLELYLCEDPEHIGFYDNKSCENVEVCKLVIHIKSDVKNLYRDPANIHMDIIRELNGMQIYANTQQNPIPLVISYSNKFTYNNETQILKFDTGNTLSLKAMQYLCVNNHPKNPDGTDKLGTPGIHFSTSEGEIVSCDYS